VSEEQKFAEKPLAVQLAKRPSVLMIVRMTAYLMLYLTEIVEA